LAQGLAGTEWEYPRGCSRGSLVDAGRGRWAARSRLHSFHTGSLAFRSGHGLGHHTRSRPSALAKRNVLPSGGAGARSNKSQRVGAFR
jgi:hypothetical protein